MSAVSEKIQSQIHAWDKVVDNARYLGVEHRHKEKEYGIKWRTAFKSEMKTVFDAMIAKHGNPLNKDGVSIDSSNEMVQFDHLEII